MILKKVVQILAERKLLEQILNQNFIETELPGELIVKLYNDLEQNKDKLSDKELLSLAKIIIEAYLTNSMLYRTALLYVNDLIDDDTEILTLKEVFNLVVRKTIKGV